MSSRLMFGGVVSMCALVACQTQGDETETTGDATAYIGSSGPVPDDGQCTHVVVTRLSDFHVSQYQGPLAGGSFQVSAGESHVTATAYGQPCGSEPADAPWIADEQIFTFVHGANQLTLAFHSNTSVTIDPTFDDDNTNLVVRPGTLVRTGRNGEDAAGPNLSLDGWEVKQFTLPPPGGAGPGTETVLFSLEGKGGMPYSPRGLARLPNGNFVAQVSETFQPVWLFDGAGNFLATDNVSYPAGTVVWDFSDGLEAIDATHLVRTGFLNTPINCDASGNNCTQSGIEVLTLQPQPDGSTLAVVTQQIVLTGAIAGDYALGVTPVSGGRFAISTLPAGGGTNLSVLNGDGTFAAGPVFVAGDFEGLINPGDGRLGAVDYTGLVQMFDATTLAARPGETENLPDGIGLSIPTRLAWNPNANQFVVLGGVTTQLVTAPADFSSTTPLPIDLSGYAQVTAIDVRASANQLMIVDRLPPIDATTSTRVPRADFYDLATHAQVQHVLLSGVATGQVRPDAVAFVGPRQQIVSHYRRPGNPVDPSLDAVVYTHNLDGSLASTFDLRPLGFPKVNSVAYLQATDEILMAATDITGRMRFVVVAPNGQPRRSYRTDAIAGFTAAAQITSGPLAGDLGVVFGQPSEYLRVSLQ
jgi:hypothetical protein